MQMALQSVTPLRSGLSRKWLETRKSNAIEDDLFFCMHGFQIMCTSHAFRAISSVFLAQIPYAIQNTLLE